MKQAVRVMHTIHPVSITKCLGGQGRNGIAAITVKYPDAENINYVPTNLGKNIKF